MRAEIPKEYLYITDLARKIKKTKGIEGSISSISSRLRKILKKRPYLTKPFKKKKTTNRLIKKRYEQIVINSYKKDLQKYKKTEEEKKKVIFYKEFSDSNFKPVELRREKNLSSMFLFSKMKIKTSEPLNIDEQKDLFMEYDYHDYYQKKDELRIKKMMNNRKNSKIISKLEKKITEHQQKKLEVEEEVFSSIVPLISKRLIEFNMKNSGCLDNLEDVFMDIYYLFRKKMKNFDQIKYPKTKFSSWFDYHIKALLYKWPWKNSIIRIPIPLKVNAAETIGRKNNTRNTFSLDYIHTSKKNNYDLPIEDIIGNEYELQDHFKEKIYRKIKSEKINRIIKKKLTGRERKILYFVFQKGLILQEIGDKIIGVSKERVRQIKEKALEKLRKDREIRKLYGMVNDSYK